jgi:hypothetical protein
VGLASALAAAACGPGDAPRVAAPAPAQEASFPSEPTALLRYHSARFGLSIPLPDGRAWRIDDHHDGVLVARHAPTRSTLTTLTFTDPDLMNRQKCQERAEAMGLLALREPRTIEDETTVGPASFDTRIWIALETGSSPGAALVGDAILVGAHVHKCLFARFVTEVPAADQEPVLSSRLAIARLRILGGLLLDAFDRAPRELGRDAQEPRP